MIQVDKNFDKNDENHRAEASEILIVDDSRTQAEHLRYILEQNHYRVLVAGNAKEALASINKCKPMMVLSDIIMPEIDGYELCRKIKSDDNHKDIPVILLTSLSDLKDSVKALSCGADNFIEKPYEEKYLLSKIEYILANRNLYQDQEAQRGTEIFFEGQKYFITASRIQILNLLLSSYETAVQKNFDLSQTRDALRSLNQNLEERVKERTANLLEEINERKRVEEVLRKKSEELEVMSQQLWQASKLATMGELAASIAHELNNPLAIVSLRLESLLMQPADESQRRTLDIIEQELERMKNLVANLLQFGRRGQQQLSRSEVEMTKELEDSLELIYYHLRNHRITVVKEFDSELPVLEADRQQLRQLFLNLFTNASDAMPQGGTLTIRVKVNRDDQNQADQAEASKLVIEIADTGLGIKPEHLQKIMEPFFTTKPEGKGTGLGLPICRRIVQEHHGTFELTSEVGKGTTFRITFPILKS